MIDAAKARRGEFAHGLRVSLVLYAGLSSLMWGVRFGSWTMVGFSFIAPPVWAVDSTARGDLDMAVGSWLVTLLALGSVFWAVRDPWPVRRRIAYAALALYWFMSSMLIGIGV